MFNSIYKNCDSAPKEISCFCGKVVLEMSNGIPRRVLECCCVDCLQHLEWAAANGGPPVPVIPTLSYWDNDLQIDKGEDYLQLVVLREKGVSRRLITKCCYSTLVVDHPFYNEVIFMLFEEACDVQWDFFGVSPKQTRPAESRIFVKDFEDSRGEMPKFLGDPARIHLSCCPPYIEKWNSLSSKCLENPKGEKCQSIFSRVPKKILGLDKGKRIYSLSDC